jgi:23S rRNA (guanosine2251-2'-O)-methyltransferase
VPADPTAPELVLEGHVSVEAALEAGVRPVHRIWATRPGHHGFRRLRALAREAGVAIEGVEPARIDEVAEGRTHGGIVAFVGARRTVSVQSLLDGVGERPLVVMLDGVEDPFNQGQAVRALYAAGIDGLVVRRDWDTALTTVTRASGGTTELMPTAASPTAADAAAACRAAGMRVVVSASDDEATDVDEADLTGAVFVLIGGERRGVTRSFVEAADERIRIRYGRDRAPDLGAATAAAVIGFAALRQRSGASGG